MSPSLSGKIKFLQQHITKLMQHLQNKYVQTGKLIILNFVQGIYVEKDYKMKKTVA